MPTDAVLENQMPVVDTDRQAVTVCDRYLRIGRVAAEQTFGYCNFRICHVVVVFLGEPGATLSGYPRRYDFGRSYLSRNSGSLREVAVK